MPAALRLIDSGNASALTSLHASPLLASPPIPLLPLSSVTSPVAPSSTPNSPNSKTNPPLTQPKISSPHRALFLFHLTNERERRRTRKSARPPPPLAPSARRMTITLTSVRLTPSPLILSILHPPCPSPSPLPQVPLHCDIPQRSPPPPQSSTWTTFVPCAATLDTSVSTAQETLRPGDRKSVV